MEKVKIVCAFISRWMGLWVLMAAVIGLAAPSVFGGIGMSVVSPLLGLVMFGMGMSLKISDLKIVFTRPKDVIIGCLSQFIVMPGLAWLLTNIFNLPPDLAVGVILVGCCPGGTASNVITYLAGGDLALSVGMTTVSTLVAPLLTPAITWLLAGTYVNVDALGMLLSILWVVILPIVAGLLAQRLLPRVTEGAKAFMPAFSSLVIALIVVIIVSHNAVRLMDAGLLVIVVVALHNLLGLALGFSVGRMLRLARPKCIALSVEVGMQNSGLASSLAVTHFAAMPMATVPGAVFSVWHNISGAIVASLYSKFGKKKEDGCGVAH